MDVAASIRLGSLLALNGFRWSINRQQQMRDSQWAGEKLRADDDFFKPLHVTHVRDWRAELLPYLALPPGWRFLIAPAHEDAWYHPSSLMPTGGPGSSASLGGFRIGLDRQRV